MTTPGELVNKHMRKNLLVILLFVFSLGLFVSAPEVSAASSTRVPAKNARVLTVKHKKKHKKHKKKHVRRNKAKQ